MPVRTYVYDGDAVLQEADGAGVTQVTYTRTGGGYGDLLSRHDGSNSRYYEPDALGSTDSLANDAQAVTDRWAYRAFGEATHATGTDATPFTWVGRQGYFSDSQTGFYLLGSGTRHYDPATAQFLSKDPIGHTAGDPTLVKYVANNPINLTDPSGLQVPEPPGALKPGNGIGAGAAKPPYRLDEDSELMKLFLSCPAAADLWKSAKECVGGRLPIYLVPDFPFPGAFNPLGMGLDDLPTILILPGRREFEMLNTLLFEVIRASRCKTLPQIFADCAKEAREDWVKRHERESYFVSLKHHEIAEKCFDAFHWPRGVDVWDFVSKLKGFEEFWDWVQKNNKRHSDAYRAYWEANCKKKYLEQRCRHHSGPGLGWRGGLFGKDPLWDDVRDGH